MGDYKVCRRVPFYPSWVLLGLAPDNLCHTRCYVAVFGLPHKIQFDEGLHNVSCPSPCKKFAYKWAHIYVRPLWSVVCIIKWCCNWIIKYMVIIMNPWWWLNSWCPAEILAVDGWILLVCSRGWVSGGGKKTTTPPPSTMHSLDYYTTNLTT